MAAHEQINSWLADPKRTFQRGYEIYTSFGRNRNIMLYLSRKQNMDKLHYELSKLLQIPEKINESIAVPAAPIGVRKVEPENTPQHKQLQFDTVDPETLPIHLKKIHAQIAEAYKFQRTYHEKLKLADTDEKRAVLRAKVVEYDEVISNGWDGIDTFKKSGEKVPVKANVKTVLDISKQINSSRSYITAGIKALPSLDEKRKAKRITEIRKRIAALVKYQATVASETREALVKLKIIDSRSKLLSE